FTMAGYAGLPPTSSSIVAVIVHRRGRIRRSASTSLNTTLWCLFCYSSIFRYLYRSLFVFLVQITNNIFCSMNNFFLKSTFFISLANEQLQHLCSYWFGGLNSIGALYTWRFATG